MTKRFAIAALVLLPLAASAQIPPTMSIVRPAIGAPAGITVTGSAQQRVQVRTLTFAAFVRGNADEAGALAAMRAAGIDEPSIGPYGNFVQSNQAMLRGTVRDVSRAKLERIASAAAEYVRAHPGTSLDNVQFSAPLIDCPALEQPARDRAFAEARRRAEAIARTAAVELGPVTAVAEAGGCPAAAGEGTSGTPVDPTTLTSVLTVSENVTFAIVPGAAPSRRRPL